MVKTNKSPFNTFIRNFYSDGFSSLMVNFYRTNLAFRLDPFISKDTTGRSSYDYRNGLTTTVNYEGAAALYIAVNNIIDGKRGADGMLLTITCAGGAILTLERGSFSDNRQNEQMETFLCITKNNTTIPFKFTTHQMKVKENDQSVVKVIESGLGAFVMTIEGYLTGIGADTHLSKLPEDFDEIVDDRQQAANAKNNNNYHISYGSY